MSAVHLVLALLLGPILLALYVCVGRITRRRSRSALADVLWLAQHEKAGWRDRLHGLALSGLPLNLEADKTLLQELTEKRTALFAEIGDAIEARQAERDKFTPVQAEFNQRTAEFAAVTTPNDEQRGAQDRRQREFAEARSAYTVAEEAFGSAHDQRVADLGVLDRRITEQELLERRREDAANASTLDARVTGEPLTYRADNKYQYSYYLDLACQQVPALASRLDDPAGRAERLAQHAAEMNVEMPKREKAREARALAQADAAEREFRGSFMQGVRRGGLDTNPFIETRVNPNRVDGQGGHFVPPIWLFDEYLPALRAGRVAAGLCRQLDLPAGTDNIKLPAVATGTTTAMQTADGASVSSTDLTDAVVECSVQTAAGQQDVAIQVIEQSPGQMFDDVITGDLYADYNRLIDRQVVMGTGLNGQVKGILPVSNWTGANTVTWTTSTPLGPYYNMAMGAAASKISYNRYSLENLHFLGHPRRWFWFATALKGASGTSGDPMVSADGFGPNNANALYAGAQAEGLAGRMPFGPNYYIDGNVPIVATAGGAVTGGTSDLSVAAKWDDLWLFEGALRTRVLPEVLSGTLQIRFQLYAYIAFLTRYGQSIAVTLGTGMAAPTAVTDTSITF